MPIYRWDGPSVPGGGDFHSAENWVEVESAPIGVPGAGDTARIGGPAHIVVTDGLVATLSGLEVLSEVTNADVVRWDGSVVVRDEVYFENDRGMLRFTGRLTLDGTSDGAAMDVDLIQVGGTVPGPTANSIGFDDEARFIVTGKASVTTRQLDVLGTGQFAVTNGATVEVAGPVQVQQAPGAEAVTVGGFANGQGSALLIQGDLSIDGTLSIGASGRVQATNAVVSSADSAALIVGDFQDGAPSARFGSQNLTLGDGQADAGGLLVLPNGHVVIDKVLTMLDTVTDGSSFSVEVVTIEGSIEIGGNQGAALDTIRIYSSASGAGLSGRGLVDTGTLQNDGSVTAKAGVLLIDADVTGKGTFTVEASATLEIHGTVASTSTVALSGTSASLVLGDPDTFAAMITSFDPTDTIRLRHAADNAVEAAAVMSGPAGEELLVIFQQNQPSPLTYRISGPQSLAGKSIVLTAGADGLSTSLAISSVGSAAISIAPLAASKVEGNAGTTSFTFTVSLDLPQITVESAAWTVAGSGTNPANAADFGGGFPAGTVTFAPGETSKTVTINVAGDTGEELDEGFSVTLSGLSGRLEAGVVSAAGTIRNDDVAAVVTAHGDAYVVLEGQSLAIAAPVGLLSNDVNASIASLLGTTAHGSLQLVGNGGFTYTPTTGFQGIDWFTYQAGNNGPGTASEKATLYVVPVNIGAATTLDLLALTVEEQIAATYGAFFGRGADAGGFGFWVDQFVSGLPVQGPAALFANIASSFGISNEAKALYPFLANPFGASDAQISAFVDSVYNNLFNRSSDAGGLGYWTDQIKQTLEAGQFVGSILVQIMGGAQDTAAGKDITTLMGKVAVSLAYVQEQQEHDTTWLGASDIAAATALLDSVTSDPQSVLVGVRNAETLIAVHA